MKLASYTPEVTRLRRIAKACAAGEMSRSAYRQARRQVIDQFLGIGQGFDDTVPRFGGDTTVRRDGAVADVSPAARSRFSYLWFIALLIGLTTLALPALSWSQAMIPPVKERVADQGGSQRLAVNAVTWQSSLADVEQQQVNQFLQDELTRIKARHQPAAHGFTEDELVEVARYLNAIGVHDAGVKLSREDVSDLQTLVERQKDKRRVSVKDLEEIASALQSYIRQRGYPLAVAYVPSQAVEAGEVQLAVEVGQLASVVMADASQRSWTDTMDGLVGSAVQRSEIETRLNLLNRMGGDVLQAGFQPGEDVGESEMVLHVAEEKRFSGRARIDNHGLDAFGQERISYQASTRQLAQLGDRLDVHVASALEGDDHLFGGVKYTVPIAERALTVSGALRYADIQWRRGVAGEGLAMLADVTQSLEFTRVQRRELRYRVGWLDVDWQGGSIEQQQSWFAGVSFDGHRLWDQAKVALEGSVGVRIGGIDEAYAGQDDDFWLLHGSALLWKPVDIGWSAKLALYGRWQWTDKHLPAGQQVSLSMPEHNPGLLPGSYFADTLTELTAQLRMSLPLGEGWVFLSGGYGEENDQQDSWYQLTTIGVGWQAELLRNEYGSLRSRMSVGHPVAHKSNGVFHDDGTQIFWSLSFDH